MAEARKTPAPERTSRLGGPDALPGERQADRAATARALFDAFAQADRAAAERLIADDFRFTSPNDDALDRAGYFEVCWPNAGTVRDFDLRHVATEGDRVFVTYEARNPAGHRFRNTELLLVRDGRVRAVEVYFGWTLPHPGGSPKSEAK
jgi:ketosteroid isomerase-like protein